ncbi:hypothetical protein CR513_10209, partial [Mucuna pruriens]
MATWEDFGMSSSNQEDEKTNIYLMTNTSQDEDDEKKGKQVRGSFASKNIVSTSRPYINLFGPTITAVMNEKHYGLVVIDDYSKWTWVMLFTYKDESFKVFSIFYKRVQNEKRTPQQNGVVARKNRYLQEM